MFKQHCFQAWTESSWLLAVLIVDHFYWTHKESPNTAFLFSYIRCGRLWPSLHIFKMVQTIIITSGDLLPRLFWPLACVWCALLRAECSQELKGRGSGWCSMSVHIQSSPSWMAALALPSPVWISDMSPGVTCKRALFLATCISHIWKSCRGQYFPSKLSLVTGHSLLTGSVSWFRVTFLLGSLCSHFSWCC